MIITTMSYSDQYFNPEPSVWDTGDRVSDMFDWHACDRLEIDIPNGLAYVRAAIWRLVTIQDTVNFWGTIKEFSELCDVLAAEGMDE